jgi:hypothetical protein
MIDRIDKRLVFKWLNNRPYFHGETEPCINGRILGLGAYFKEPNDALANQLLGEQLEDGGWNCEAWPFLSPKRPPSRRSSFHTTICVLEGLLDYERAGRKSAAVTKARKRAENYLLERRMFRSLRTGKVIDERWLRFSFPTFWHYDVLRGLEYLRNAGIKPDRRVRDAIKVVIERRHQNGRWQLNLLHPEHIPLQMETDVGSASRWNTLRSPRPALVQQLNALVVSWACSRSGLGQNVAANLPFGTGDGLCGSYPSKPDSTITSGLPTIQSEQLVRVVCQGVQHRNAYNRLEGRYRF